MNEPSKICGRQPLKIIIFKGCLPQILFGPFLNTLFQIMEIIGQEKFQVFLSDYQINYSIN